VAEAGVDRFASAGRPEALALLLDRIDGQPMETPRLFAWYAKGLKRGRWEGRVVESYPLLQRVLKVLDGVAYRARRTSTERDRRGEDAIADFLLSKNGELVREAVKGVEQPAARHLILVMEKNRGLAGRALQKATDIVLRARPDALREPEKTELDEGEIAVGARLDRVYMTAEGMARLKAQRDRILHEELPANAKEIARAREFGDLSENAEYHAAREKQALLQARADAMSGELARAAPITAAIVRTDAVSVGARVRLEDKEGHEVTYTLLGPPDVDVKRGIINYLTPLGQALMGRKPGEHVQVVFEDGSRDLVILSVENGMVSAGA